LTGTGAGVAPATSSGPGSEPGTREATPPPTCREANDPRRRPAEGPLLLDHRLNRPWRRNRVGVTMKNLPAVLLASEDRRSREGTKAPARGRRPPSPGIARSRGCRRDRRWNTPRSARTRAPRVAELRNRTAEGVRHFGPPARGWTERISERHILVPPQQRSEWLKRDDANPIPTHKQAWRSSDVQDACEPRRVEAPAHPGPALAWLREDAPSSQLASPSVQERE